MRRNEVRNGTAERRREIYCRQMNGCYRRGRYRRRPRRVRNLKHTVAFNLEGRPSTSTEVNETLFLFQLKVVSKLTQDLNLIENTVFSVDYVIFLLNYKVHRIGLFVE